VFENRVLRGYLDLQWMKWREARGGCIMRTFITCMLYYTSPNIVRVIKSRRMRLAEHVAHMGEMRKVYRILVGKFEGKVPLRRPPYLLWNQKVHSSIFKNPQLIPIICMAQC